MHLHTVSRNCRSGSLAVRHEASHSACNANAWALEANARLISSAPELLRVAKDAADFLLRTARVLDEWAVQSQNGGWSTHQVEGNLRVANDCRREADCIQRVIDRATGAEGTRP
jgi:hypothetical protein